MFVVSMQSDDWVEPPLWNGDDRGPDDEAQGLAESDATVRIANPANENCCGTARGPLSWLNSARITTDPDDEPEDAEAGQARLLRDFDDVIDHLPHLQRVITRADLAVGGAADSVRLAAILGTSVNSIRVSRNKARHRIRSEMLKRGHFGDAWETTP